jgi:hypothetical protein
MYTTKITLNKKKFTVGIILNGQGYDLEIETKSPLSGNEFQVLKRYLEDEGYIDAARSWFGDNSIC